MKRCGTRLYKISIALWSVILIYTGAPRCKFTENVVNLLVRSTTSEMSCHHTEEASKTEEDADENVRLIRYASRLVQSSDACHCQFSQYIGVSLVRPVVQWDEYFSQEPMLTALSQIHYLSRFHSDYQAQPDTPPPKV